MMESQIIFFSIRKKTKVISLAFDGVDSMIYWTTATRGYEGVYRGKLDGSSKPELVAPGKIIIEQFTFHTDYRREDQIKTDNKSEIKDASSVLLNESSLYFSKKHLSMTQIIKTFELENIFGRIV
jgi:hypothetical protein